MSGERLGKTNARSNSLSNKHKIIVSVIKIIKYSMFSAETDLEELFDYK